MDQHDLDAIIKHLQADPVVKASTFLAMQAALRGPALHPRPLWSS